MSRNNLTPTKTEPAVLSCPGINKAIVYMKNDFTVSCLYANHIAPNMRILRGSRRRKHVSSWTLVRVSSWRLWSICHPRPTFHNDSNLCGPVLALSAAGQNTQGIRAEYIPLSGSRSHSTLSFPFRFYALGNEGFFLSCSVDNLLKPCCWRMIQKQSVHFSSTCSRASS